MSARDRKFVVCALAALTVSAPICAADSGLSTASAYASISSLLDSNLFRLPAEPASSGIFVPAGLSRSDQITDAGGGIDASVHPGNQTLALHGAIDGMHFDRNSELDHVAGSGRLSWDWASGTALTGQFSAGYDRFLGGFVNNRIFAKDLIDHSVEAASLRWAVGSAIAIRVAVDTGKVNHGAEIQQFQSNRNNSGRAGVEYVLAGADTIGLDYRATRAHFTDELLTYTDETTSGRISYAISAKTHLEADVGLHRRRYPSSAAEKFSGGIGHATIDWRPTQLTSVTLKGWRELAAYLNNESDYYVSRGGLASVGWKPMELLAISLDGRWERQDYKGSGLGALATVRQDDVSSGNLALKWTPRKWLECTLSGGVEHRASSQGYFSYSDRVAGAKMRLIW